MASSTGSDDDDSAKGKINKWQESSQVSLFFHSSTTYPFGEHFGGVYSLNKSIFTKILLFVKIQVHTRCL
jgi:hypothetical protein